MSDYSSVWPGATMDGYVSQVVSDCMVLCGLEQLWMARCQDDRRSCWCMGGPFVVVVREHVAL